MTERDIFSAARGLTDPTARAEYLTSACGDDPVLRSRVQALLLASGQPDSLLDNPAVGRDDPDATATCTGHDTVGEGDDVIPLGFLEPSTRPDAIGRIGHYEVLQVLGRGGFGIVFRAFDEILLRVVAIKVLAPHMASTSPARRRFLREARSSAQVRHENVVQVYEVGESPLPYIAMEFIPGETLHQRMDRAGPFEVTDVVRIGRQIAEGLAAAHATDLIHRDIKPGNVLLEEGTQKVKISDFGLARAADDASISQSGIIAGTPMYMAPEQAKGEPLDQRVDLFSLGSVLYAMITGRPPFRANSTVAVLKRVAEDTPRAIREVIPETPKCLCDIVAKLHAKRPDDRFQTAREVADLLADCQSQLEVSSKLRDLSRIPQPKKKQVHWRMVAATAGVLVLLLSFSACGGLLPLFAVTTPGAPSDQADKGELGGIPPPTEDSPPLPPTFTNRLGMEFVIVPKGTGWIGSLNGTPGVKMQFDADYYLGRYEVTQGEWERVMGDNPSHFSPKGDGSEMVAEFSAAELKRFPVENVSWVDCQEFLTRLNAQPGDDGWVYRLPSGAEWEYACRGGPVGEAASRFDFYLPGPTHKIDPSLANFSKRLERTCQVGSYPANRLGLHDMHGNVWEWCDDTTKEAYRVLRGGNWDSVMPSCRAENQNAGPPDGRNSHHGLRLVRCRDGQAAR